MRVHTEVFANAGQLLSLDSLENSRLSDLNFSQQFIQTSNSLLSLVTRVSMLKAESFHECVSQIQLCQSNRSLSLVALSLSSSQTLSWPLTS